MSSFYGGKQGRTYNIVKRFDTVAAMVQAFSGGGAYTEVNYGQYVIIDTVLTSGRSNLENGLLYRRGFDYNATTDLTKPNQTDSKYRNNNGGFDQESFQYDWSNWVQNPGAGAIYVGQIVGPEGQTAKVKVEKWSQFVTQKNSHNYDGDWNSIYLDRNPGKYKQNNQIKYRDNVQVAYVNIRNQHGDIEQAFIAFDIPYTSLETELVNTDPYMAAATVYENPASTAHPFYYKWDFEIPAGKHGEDVYQMVKETGKDIGYSLTKDTSIKSGKTYYTKNSSGNYTAVATPVVANIKTYYEKNTITTDGEGKAIVTGDQYITYSTRSYQESAEGDVTSHLGRWPYRVINEISPVSSARQFFTWTSGASASEGQIYKIQDGQADTYVAICIKSGKVGTLPSFGTQIGKVVQSNTTQWLVTTLPKTAPANIIRVDYKAGNNTDLPYRQINYIFVDSLGKMYATYTDNPSTAYYVTEVNSIKSIDSDNNQGFITIRFKNGTSQQFSIVQDFTASYKDSDSTFTVSYWKGGIKTTNKYFIKAIKSIQLTNANEPEQQKFVATYNYKNSNNQAATITQNVSGLLNSILAFDRYGDNIILLYSDPTVRENIPSDKVIIRDWVNPVSGIAYSNLRWYNLGPLGAQYHVQGEFTLSDILPDGWLEHGFRDFTNIRDPYYSPIFVQYGDLSDRAGWVITIAEGNKKSIYAYDYQDGTHEIQNGSTTVQSHWYKLKDLDSALVDSTLSLRVSAKTASQHYTRIDGSSIPFMADNLNENGLWFIVSGGHD